MILSPHEGDGDIEQERAKEVGGIKPGGDGQDDFGREASEVLGLSLRHVRRLLVAYRGEGAAALAHDNRDPIIFTSGQRKD